MAGEFTIKVASVHDTPPTGYQKLYPKLDGLWYTKTDAGIEVPVFGGTITTKVRNETGGVLSKHKLVTVVGFSVAENRPLVNYADKDDPDLRPAIAILLADLADNGNADALVVGTITDVDTSSFGLTDQLVVGNSGDWSRPPPDVDPFTVEIQNVGSTARIHASLGEVGISIDGLNAVTGAQIFALAGTNGTPGPANKYVTNSDPRLAGSNVPTRKLNQITSNYSPTMAQLESDGPFIAVDTTSGDVTVTLPAADTIPDDDHVRQIWGHHLAGSNIFKIVCDGEDFKDGLPSIVLRLGNTIVVGGMYRGSTVPGWLRLSRVNQWLQIRRAATWASSNFSSPAAVPFDTQDVEDNAEVIEWEDVTNPSRITVKYTGTCGLCSQHRLHWRVKLMVYIGVATEKWHD